MMIAEGNHRVQKPTRLQRSTNYHKNHIHIDNKWKRSFGEDI